MEKGDLGKVFGVAHSHSAAYLVPRETWVDFMKSHEETPYILNPSSYRTGVMTVDEEYGTESKRSSVMNGLWLS